MFQTPNIWVTKALLATQPVYVLNTVCIFHADRVRLARIKINLWFTRWHASSPAGLGIPEDLSLLARFQQHHLCAAASSTIRQESLWMPTWRPLAPEDRAGGNPGLDFCGTHSSETTPSPPSWNILESEQSHPCVSFVVPKSQTVGCQSKKNLLMSSWEVLCSVASSSVFRCVCLQLKGDICFTSWPSVSIIEYTMCK